MFSLPAISREEHRAKSNGRTPKCLRGLAYTSNAVREYSNSPELLSLASAIARKPLAVHPVSMNMAHVNFSKAGAGDVDKWHTDSVVYVLILVLSDTAGMKGGALQVLNMPDATGETFAAMKEHGVPSQLVNTVSGLRPGYGVLVQGSKILHRVTGVIEALEPRVSLVNSLTSLDVFTEDATKYHCFASQARALPTPSS